MPWANIKFLWCKVGGGGALNSYELFIRDGYVPSEFVLVQLKKISVLRCFSNY